VNDSDCSGTPGPAGCAYSTATGSWACITYSSCG
jgi:hypothetical protein